MKTKFLTIIISLFILAPLSASALQLQDFLAPGVDLGFSAKSYLVAERNTGQVLLSKNSKDPWVPASLTKLVAILTVLDLKPDLKKTVAITADDQTAGQCKKGGACLATKPGVAYTVDGLFHASLIASANNAANALARSTGLQPAEFVAKMNEKARSLGAENSHFNEPTGMDAKNSTTAEDYAKITAAAFNNPYLKGIAQKKEYTLLSANNKLYKHKLKNTNQLVGDERVSVVGGKTGFLDESGYNFGSWLADRFGSNFIVVLFGSRSAYAEFDETRKLLDLGGLAMAFKGSVLGTSTAPMLDFNH